MSHVKANARQGNSCHNETKQSFKIIQNVKTAESTKIKTNKRGKESPTKGCTCQSTQITDIMP